MIGTPGQIKVINQGREVLLLGDGVNNKLDIVAVDDAGVARTRSVQFAGGILNVLGAFGDAITVSGGSGGTGACVFDAVSNYADLATAISTIGATSTTLVIDNDCVVASNLTIPSNVWLFFIDGKQISPDTSVTVTIYSPEHIIATMRQQVFGGSGTIAFTKGGTVYPQWWGAKGDGTNDDLSAINKALTAAANGSTILFYSGLTFYVSDKITVSKDRITLTGGGGIKGNASAASETQLFYVTGADVTIDGLYLDCNGISYGRGIQVHGGARPTIRNCYCVTTGQAFVYLSGVVTNAVVVNNRHRGNGYGVLVNNNSSGSRGLLIVGNEFTNYPTGATPSTAYGDGVELNCPTYTLTDFVIADNKISACGNMTGNEGIGIGVANCSNGAITGNYIGDTEGDGIHIEDGSYNISVVGNTLYHIGCSEAGVSAAIAIIQSDRIVIANNTIHNTYYCYGILLSDYANYSAIRGYENRVVNNMIAGVAYDGIKVSGQIRALVQGNAIWNAGTYAANTYKGINFDRVSGSYYYYSEESVIKDNMIAKGTNYLLYGIYVGAYVYTTYVEKNTFNGISTVVYVASSSSTYAKAAFVDRGNPSSWDITQASMTMNGYWQTWDISGIVPYGATAVAVCGYAQDATATAAFGLRKSGSSDYSRIRVVIPVENARVEFAGVIPLPTSSRVLQYVATETFDAIGVAIMGWFF